MLATPPCETNQENFKTCSDILVILDDTNLQRNVGLEIHDWIDDWVCDFMIGRLILINKPRGGSWLQRFSTNLQGNRGHKRRRVVFDAC